jgi:23S rRNA (cytosine1962-C5)-methyltransferase
MITVELHRTHAGPVAAGHPWVYAQAVHRVSGTAEDGAEVVVVDPSGKGLGRGFWSADSAIPVRLLTRDPSRSLDEGFFAERLSQAVALRTLAQLPEPGVNDGYRLVHAEGDRLPGLVVDVYGDTAVVQLLTAAMAQRRGWLGPMIAERAGLRRVITAPNLSTQQRVAEPSEVLFGDMPDELVFTERGFRFRLAATNSQKTGYYFDQRPHRARIEALARGRSVLDAYSYVGGFGLAAARGGAKDVLAIDSSEPAVSQGARIAAENGLSDRLHFKRADVRDELVRMREAGQLFDMLVLDPPKLVPTAKHLERGRNAYRKLNRDALGLVRPGGVLVTCSCSAAMTETDFLRMLAFASGDARREISVIAVGRQGEDHPILPGFSEGAYLKTVFAVVR